MKKALAGMQENRPVLEWLDDNHLVIGALKFVVTDDEEIYHRMKSTRDEFLVIKTRAMIEDTLSLIGLRPGRILEIGIWQGGGTVVLNRALDPNRLVAIDINREPLAALQAYIDRFARRDVLKTYYGVEQAAGGWVWSRFYFFGKYARYGPTVSSLSAP